jgi:hypothetical protein
MGGRRLGVRRDVRLSRTGWQYAVPALLVDRHAALENLATDRQAFTGLTQFLSLGHFRQRASH